MPRRLERPFPFLKDLPPQDSSVAHPQHMGRVQFHVEAGLPCPPADGDGADDAVEGSDALPHELGVVRRRDPSIAIKATGLPNPLGSVQRTDLPTEIGVRELSHQGPSCKPRSGGLSDDP